jgi:hypothetical protein
MKGPQNNALQLTRARSAQQVRAERHFVPHRASIIYGPSQLNAVFDRPWRQACSASLLPPAWIPEPADGPAPRPGLWRCPNPLLLASNGRPGRRASARCVGQGARRGLEAAQARECEAGLD